MDESGLIAVDSVEALFETIVANKTETGWMESVSNFFTGNVCNTSFINHVICYSRHHVMIKDLF